MKSNRNNQFREILYVLASDRVLVAMLVAYMVLAVASIAAITIFNQQIWLVGVYTCVALALIWLIGAYADTR